jgi:DNA uptake protein ComE-like DNA-binding protein/Tfp pilus assembly protein PilX
MNNERGFILLLTFIFMIVLTALVGSLLFMVTYETRDMGVQIQDYKLLNLAEAGLARALRAIREDVSPASQTGTAYLRGADTTGSSGVANVARIRYIGESTGNATIDADSDIAQLRALDANYTGTRIISIYLGVRAKRAGGGTGATIQVSYTTNGVFPEAGNTALIQALSTTRNEYFANITADRTWTWPAIMSSNFILRAQRSAGDRNINLDAIYLRVTYEIDTNTEPWATGSYATFPISLGSGTIQSVSIIAEQGKIHLNTASQPLLRYLMVEHGVADATANTVATNIVNYRATNNFDSIEEVQQVSGMTLSIYDVIKPDITVYSFINTYAQGPLGARAPININTASREVLEAIFDPLNLGATDPASLATDIINTRAAAPFSCFYSFDSAVTTDFYDFARSRNYLSAAGDPDEQDRVIDNADASLLAPVAGSTGFSAVTAEFCYDANTFKVESLADVLGRKLRIKTIFGKDGAHTFTTFVGDTTTIGYRKENFE